MSRKTDVGQRAPRYTIQAVRRAAQLLDAIAVSSTPLTAAEAAQAVGLNVSTCHHLLNTLVAEGLAVHREDATYWLGPQLLYLAGRLSEAMPSLPQLVSELDELNARSRETSYLLAWHGDHLSVLAARLGLESVVVGDLELGAREHAHAKASGKSILAFSSSEAVDRYIERHPLPALTPKTVVDPDALRSQLVRIRKLGYAEEIEEFALGIACIAAPIRRSDGRAIGALALSVPLQRFRSRRKQLIEEVVRSGRRASAAMGVR